jgi:hypothetical protein
MSMSMIGTLSRGTVRSARSLLRDSITAMSPFFACWFSRSIESTSS